MVQVSCQKNIENFSRNLYVQIGGLHVRVLILVCAPDKSFSNSIFYVMHIQILVTLCKELHGTTYFKPGYACYIPFC